MKRCALLLLVVVTAAHANAQTDDLVGVYGYVRRVVVEPNAENPTRLQVWGTFSIAVSGSPADYHAPERGYLYFQLPTDTSAALAEWTQLKVLADTGGPWPGGHFYGITAFGRRDMSLRVRTSDEKPNDPVTYQPGLGVVQVSYDAPSAGVKMLGQLPKPASRRNYAIVERVVVEPNANEPTRIQIWGVFTMGNSDGYSFAPPMRGYLYLTRSLDVRVGRVAVEELSAWQSVAGTSVVRAFEVFDRKDGGLRVRKPDERPDAPDPYSVRFDPSVVRPDTAYRPVKMLLGFR